MRNQTDNASKRSSPALLPAQIKEYIVASIRDGDLTPHAPVPSQRSLCDRFGVCRATVTAAFKDLVRDGLVYQIQGKGTYVADELQVTSYLKRDESLESALTTRRRPRLAMIALLVPFDTKQEARLSDDLFLQEIMDEARTLLIGKGYALKVCFVKNEAEAFDRLHLDADGLLVLASRVDRGYIRYCRQTVRRPVVVMGRVFPDEGLPSVSIDYVGGGRQAIEYLLCLGHREIGHIQGPSNHYAGVEVSKGVASAISDAGLDLRPEWTAGGDFTEAGGRRAMARLLKARTRPSALFVSNDTMAIGAMQVLKEHGMRIPDDISIIGFDGIPAGAKTSPPLTTIYEPTREMATLAATALADLIAGKQGAATGQELPTSLVERKSCRPVRAADTSVRS